ncbi:MAG: hypothetical protein RR576_01395 [Oscillospiraceae bacterium]
MMPTIIEALREYFLNCPLLGKNRLGINYLPEKGLAYSIDTTPTTKILQQYMSGTTLRQYLFILSSVTDYGADELQNLANSGFYEHLADWLEAQTKIRNFPKLSDGQVVQKIEAQSTGYFFGAEASTGKYQIQCRLIYLQKGAR